MAKQAWKQFPWVGIVLVWWLGACAGQRADAAIVINEVLADPPAGTGDANGDGIVSSLQDEFIELANSGSTPVSLASWRLSDAVQVRHTFPSDALIAPYGLYVIFGSTASTGGLSLNNGGDTVSLHDATLALIDQMVYGAEGGQDTSLTRSPDGSGVFVQHKTLTGTPFSAGLTVNGLALLPHEEPSDDFVEPDASAPSVPEPSTACLLAMGVAGFPLVRRRRIMNSNDEKVPAGHHHSAGSRHRGDWGVCGHV